MTGARYRVEHETRYVYTASVSTSQHVAHLAPRTLPRQVVETHTLEVDPAPAQLSEREDYFGNRVHGFTILTPHAGDAGRQPQRGDGLATRHGARARGQPRLGRGRLRDGLPQGRGADQPRPSSRTARRMRSSARSWPPSPARRFRPGRPLLDAAGDLMHRIHDEFTFDPSATTITTPVTRVLADRHGVCQDFAHLRSRRPASLGLAARYVSGYLLTDPPPGQPRLTGADASHAWVSVHCPRHGWVDFDPTNACLPDVRHITIGWGRDYGDVSPLRGADSRRRPARAGSRRQRHARVGSPGRSQSRRALRACLGRIRGFRISADYDARNCSSRCPAASGPCGGPAIAEPVRPAAKPRQ